MGLGPNSVLTYGQIVGAVVRAERVRFGVTQQAAARMVELTQASYSRLERGTHAMSVVQLDRLSHLFGVEAHVMLQRADVVARLAREVGWTVEIKGAARKGAASIDELVKRALAPGAESGSAPST